MLDGAPSAVDKMSTETGTKDKYLLLVECKKIKNEQGTRPGTLGMSKREEVQLALASMRERMPKNIFNPVLMVYSEHICRGRNITKTR